MGWIIPAVLGAGSLVSGLLENKAKANQAQDQSNLYNDWLTNYKNQAQGLLGGAQAAGFNPYGPKVSTSQGYGSSTGQSNTNFSNRPVITGEYAPLDQLMRSIMSGRLAGGSSLPQGYAENAIRGINESYEGTDQAARNLASRRGLSPEQTYAIASPANRARAGAIADLRGSLPLLERQLQNEDIGITSGLQSAFGTGQTGRSSTSQRGSTSNYGTSSSPFTVGDLSGLVNLMSGPGPQQTTQTGYSPLGQGLGDASSILAWMLGQGLIGGNKAQSASNPWTGVGMYL